MDVKTSGGLMELTVSRIELLNGIDRVIGAVDKRAVRRNLWKRRIREIFRKRQREWAAGTLIVVQARALPQVPESSALEEDFIKLCTQAGIRRETEIDA